jgi:NADH pyrophosphatase NudC (nudix superfamily)
LIVSVTGITGIAAPVRPAAAIAREMHEELGVLIEDWAPFGLVTGTAEFRRDRMQIFRAELRDSEIELDRAELATMQWFRRQALPRDVPGYVPQILGGDE